MRNLLFLISVSMLVIVVIVSGCISEEKKPLYNFTKDGVEYIFANNIYDALNTTLEDGVYIRNVLDSPLSIIVVFNGSSAEDNAYFSVVSYNMVEKLKNHYEYTKGRMVDFMAIDLQDNQTMPQGSTIIILKGPNTGADRTAVYYDNACVYNSMSISLHSRCVIVQGTEYKGLTLAADKLVLFITNFKE